MDSLFLYVCLSDIPALTGVPLRYALVNHIISIYPNATIIHLPLHLYIGSFRNKKINS